MIRVKVPNEDMKINILLHIEKIIVLEIIQCASNIM